MIFLLVIMGVLAMDQVAKFIVQSNMIEGQSTPVIDGIFHLTYVRNPGAAFGIFPDRTSFFILVTLLVIIIVVFFYRQIPREKILMRMALGLMVGGALGNLLDRIRLGRVVDFFDFQVWPVFNIADMAVVFGVGILILELLRSKDEEA